MEDRALQAIGIDPELPAGEKAAALIRRLVLRWDAITGPRQLGTVVEAGWFAGPTECLKVLVQLCRGTTARGTAFASPWPYLEFRGRILAPALPVVAGDAEATGPDGVYLVEDGLVWREAVGTRRRFMAIKGSTGPGDSPFELLWFGSGERYLIRNQLLEVDDLFSSLRIRATAELVERLLIRKMRVEAEAVSGLRLADRPAPAEIEVRQSVELLSSEAWRDSIHVLVSRADMRTANRHGDEIHGHTVGGEDVVFKLAEEAGGWRLYRWEGNYPLRALSLVESEGDLSYSVTLGSALDPFSPGVRGRVVFDLRSELVALQSS
jgi:hypothetical protein